MGWSQSALPLWSAMISFRRQIGLLGDFQGEVLVDLGDQLHQILGASCAMAGASARNKAAAASETFRYFIKSTPQTHVFVIETMSASSPEYNRQDGRTVWQKRV